MVLDIIISIDEYRKIRPYCKNIKKLCGERNIMPCYVLRGAAVRLKVSPDYFEIYSGRFSMVFKIKDSYRTPGKSGIVLDMSKHDIIDIKMHMWEAL